MPERNDVLSSASVRLALIASSSYATCQKLTELPGADTDVDLLAQRLSEPDAGFSVYSFRAERGLAEAVEQVLSEVSEPVEELLFFFSGYAMLNDERGPALLLDGERLGTFSLKRLRRLLGERARTSLAVLDTVPAFDGVTSSADAVRSLGAALSEANSNIHLLASSRPESAALGRSPFASLFELVLDWQAGNGSSVLVDGLFAAMRAEAALFAEVPAAEYFPGAEPFALLRPFAAPPLSEMPGPIPDSAAEHGDALDPEQQTQPRAMFESAVLPTGSAILGPPPAESAAVTEAVTEAGEGPLPPPLGTEIPAETLEQVRATLRDAPRNAATYRRLSALFERDARPDGVWNAACALEALGAADVNESLLATLHRPEGLLQAQGVLGEEEWRQKLLSPERDPALDELFGALGDAKIMVGLETARRKRRIPELDPETEQDLEKSTTMLARTLLWSARLLGVPRPRLYLTESSPAEIGFVPALEPTALASKSLGSGLSLAELAFLWARKLVLLRPEHRVATLFPEPGELEALAAAALALGAATDRAFKRLEGDAKLFARSLKRFLPGAERAALKEATRRLSRATLGRHVQAWTHAVELAGGRAGLLACGDLGLALKLSERFATTDATTSDERAADLLAYCVSDEYAALRARLGVVVRP